VTTPGTDGTGADDTTGAPSRTDSWFHRLHTGTGAFDIVGKRRRWYAALALLFVVCVASLGLKGFNLGIDFVGGTKLEVPTTSAQGTITTDQAQKAFADALGHPAETAQQVGTGSVQTIQIRSSSLQPQQVEQVKQTMVNELHPIGVGGQQGAQVISDSGVSGTWGGEITRQAVIALGVFLVLVTAFLAFYFERWMAVSALVALISDVVATAGIYSLVGVEVTPSTVIGLLTILGFSLYDTVVVFDKVRENTRGLLSSTRQTYREAANLAINQTLMRSINTSVVALLPVLGLLVVGAGLLGVGVLRDLALVQLVGIASGVVSSIFLAVPLLVDLKMREPRFREHERKVLQRRRRGEPADEDVDSDADERSGGAENALSGAAASSEFPEPPRRPSGNGAGGAPQPSGKNHRPSGKKRR
jgi:preprotein translocase subunit SecF